MSVNRCLHYIEWYINPGNVKESHYKTLKTTSPESVERNLNKDS